MANYIANARTNYVKVDDLTGFSEYLNRFTQASLIDNGGMYGALFDGGAFPEEDDEETGSYVEFDYEHLMSFVKEGEVLVVKEIGYERMRYFVGRAWAYQRKGAKVESVRIDLDQIHDLAELNFGTGGTPVEY